MIKNKLEIINDIKGDYSFYATYIYNNRCFFNIKRLDCENDGIESIILRIYDVKEKYNFEDIKLESRKELDFTFNIFTKMFLEMIDYNYQQKIPKIIIQTSKYDKNINQIHNNVINTLIELNPEYEYNFFTDAQRRIFICDNFDENVLKAYDTLIPGAFKADLFRYCYLYIHGGCYFDDKTIIRKPLRDIIRNDDELLLCIDYEFRNSNNRRHGNSYLNSIIMTVEKNDNIKILISECVNNILYNQDKFYKLMENNVVCDMLLLTGPRLVFEVLKNRITDNNLRFKHIIKEHNRGNYKNFMIIDIDTNELIFTKSHCKYFDQQHYSFLWLNKNIFIK